MIVDEKGAGLPPLPLRRPIPQPAPLVDPTPYVQALSYMNPQSILLERYTPPEKVGMIFKPTETKKAEARSSVWGKVLRMSEFESEDPEVVSYRKGFKVGDWVNFLVTNPIAGGHPENTRVQLLAVQDVLIAMDDKGFNEHVKDKY